MAAGHYLQRPGPMVGTVGVGQSPQHGQPLEQAFTIGSFAERMLLHENSLVKIDPDLPLDRAALVGCGVLTGVGAALRTSGLQAGQTAPRPGGL